MAYEQKTTEIDGDAIKDAVREAYAQAAEVQRIAAKPALTPEEVTTLYGFSISALEKMRSENRGPAYIRLSAKKILYARESIEKWLSVQTIQPRAI